MKILALLCLFLSLPALADNDVLNSPVQIVDYAKVLKVIDSLDGNPKMKAVSGLVSIIYDAYLERPWPNILTEADARWQHVRAEFCPALKNLCALPEKADTEEHFAAIVNGLNPAVMSELQAALRKEAAPGYFDMIFPVAGEPIFSALLSGEETEKKFSELHVWDMSAKNLTLKEKEYLFVSDILTYVTGFGNGEQSSAYVFRTADGAALNLDLVIVQALNYAKIWKQKVTSVRLKPELGKDPGLYSEAYIYSQAFQRNANRFAEIYKELSEKLKTIPADRAGNTAARFAAERANGDYPEEVYQAVVYEIFRGILSSQAKYFMVAPKTRAGGNFKKQVWESLLTVQAENDPQLVLYFASLESIFPLNGILNQFVNPRVAPAFFYEEIKAVLDEGEFAGKNAYSHYSYLLKAPELLEADFLESDAPEVYNALLDPTTKKLKDIFSLSEAEQKRVWHLYVYGKDGKIQVRPLFRIINALITRITQDDGQALAKYVHEVRAAEFTP